jgi:hypothetical protein
MQPNATLRIMLSNARCRLSAGTTITLTATLAAIGLGMVGCASPGPPRAPSLNLPGSPAELTATRRGDIVELRFNLPQRSTDHLPLPHTGISAQLCRSVDPGACLPIAGFAPQTFLPTTNNHATSAVLRDTLPPSFTSGPPHLISYRVQLSNAQGHTAGYSDAVYTLAGAAPQPVEDLAARSSRLGIVLSWNPTADDHTQIAFRREDLSPKPPATPKPSPTNTARTKPTVPTATHAQQSDDANITWLGIATMPDANTPDIATPTVTGALLDTTALADTSYRYTAERRRTVQLGGRTLEILSNRSATVLFTLHDTYPPPPPTDLSAASFASTTGSSNLEVDLIWQPVDDPGLAGYNIYRQFLDSSGTPTAPIVRLNKSPVHLPAFHDELPSLATPSRYLYKVSSIDTKNNESQAATTTLELTAP